MFVVSERWMTAYPHAMVALLVAKAATNVKEQPELEARKRALELELRTRFANPEDIKLEKAVQAYTAYYKRFQKTYHLVQQMKTVFVKQKPLPTVSGLVDVMFMAEMKNLLLTAGHDLATVVAPVILEAAAGTEAYTKLNQESQVAKEYDMMLVDGEGILSSVIHGPDYRSRITLSTTDILYVVYAPDGITVDAVYRHLRDIKDGILLFSPSAGFERVRILSAHGMEEMEI